VIRHVVMWRLKSRPAQGGHLELEQRIEQNLAALRTSVPGLLHAWLGLNQAESADASDLVLCCEFHSWDALRGYESHPVHQELRAIIGPLRAERRVVDFEFDDRAAAGGAV
jgi:stress responsive alpha/beta barrel protein